MALRNGLTLRRPRSGRLEGRAAVIQVPCSVGSVSSVVNLPTMCPGALVGNGQDQVLPRGTLVVSVISGTCHGCNEMLNRTAVGSDRGSRPGKFRAIVTNRPQNFNRTTTGRCYWVAVIVDGRGDISWRRVAITGCGSAVAGCWSARRRLAERCPAAGSRGARRHPGSSPPMALVRRSPMA